MHEKHPTTVNVNFAKKAEDNFKSPERKSPMGFVERLQLQRSQAASVGLNA